MKEENEISNEFKNIEKPNKVKSYVLIAFLYSIVIILCVFLYLGLKHQKQVVKDNLEKDNINNSDIDIIDDFDIETDGENNE